MIPSLVNGYQPVIYALRNSMLDPSCAATRRNSPSNQGLALFPAKLPFVHHLGRSKESLDSYHTNMIFTIGIYHPDIEIIIWEYDL